MSHLNSSDPDKFAAPRVLKPLEMLQRGMRVRGCERLGLEGRERPYTGTIKVEVSFPGEVGSGSLAPYVHVSPLHPSDHPRLVRTPYDRL